jgi:hypothetical protein
MGSVSCGTIRPEDLIPTFTTELESLAKQPGIVSGKRRHEHLKLVREVEHRILDEREFEDQDLGIDGTADADLDSLFTTLDEYAAPYFYFGAHPGDSADYGWWLSEDWDSEFIDATHNGAPALRKPFPGEPADRGVSLRVNDLAEVPAWFRGEVAVVNDHGNVTLYVKTCRTLRAIWSVV